MDSFGNEVKRSDFPHDFIFGAATSAYQVEGAWDADGKGRSNWDHFTLHTPAGTADGSNGCVALDQYNMFKDDVDLMKKVGLDSYRFSIAWSRILPGGRLCGGVSKEGIKYYNNLIDTLLAGGIEPWVTIFHWDVPQCLEAEYGGFLNNRIVNDFCDFAEVCFWEFGDRVKHWITLNEPWSFTIMGYVDCMFPPCRGRTPPHVKDDKSATSNEKPVDILKVNHRMPSTRLLPFGEPKGDSGTEPYTVAHNLILAHAHVVNIYREKYKEYQRGKIGMSNVSVWFYPFDQKNRDDVEAASRAVDFMLGWFVAPVIKGDYPLSMRKIVGERLPKFKENEVTLVKDSCDFLGINYYTAYYAKNRPMKTSSLSDYENDLQVEYLFSRNGVLIGPQAGSKWLYIVPDGIYHLMLHIKETYNNPDIYITENGVNEKNDKNATISKARVDKTRIDYHKAHLAKLRDAKKHDHVNVKGYFIWSLLDNFEWAEGYTVRFGIFYADFVNGRLTRFPKNSAIWWTKFLNKTKTPWNILQRKPIIEGNQQAEKAEEGEHGTVKRPRCDDA